MAADEENKREPIPVDEAAIAPELPVEGEVEVPYSIYTSKEKWLIVAMVALAGFYRYTLFPFISSQENTEQQLTSPQPSPSKHLLPSNPNPRPRLRQINRRHQPNSYRVPGLPRYQPYAMGPYQ